MNGTIVNFKEDRKVWDSFVRTSPQRSIFVETKFLDSLLARYDLVTCYENDVIVAGTVVIYSESGAPLDAQHVFTQYQGILLADNTARALHSQLTRELKIVEYFIDQLLLNYGKLCFCQSWRFRDMRPFQWHNYHEPSKGMFKLELGYTGVLDSKEYGQFDHYLSSIRTVRRQEYRKASRRLVMSNSADAAILDDLHDKTFGRQSISRPPQEEILVKSIADHALAGNYGKICYATLDEIPISAVLFLYDDRTAYYMFGANDPAYRNASGGTFLLVNMIKEAFESGLKEVDFVGINSPNRGDYKVSFNAEIRPYFVASLE